MTRIHFSTIISMIATTTTTTVTTVIITVIASTDTVEAGLVRMLESLIEKHVGQFDGPRQINQSDPLSILRENFFL